MDEFLRLLETVFETFEFGQSPQAFLVLVGLAFARLLAFLVVVPFFGGAAVPARVKVATATAFVVIVYPSLAAGLKGEALGFGPVGFIGLLAKEAFVGFTLGFVASLVFEAVQVAGRVIDFQRGSTLAELFAPQLQTRVSELGQFKLQLAIVIFLGSVAPQINVFFLSLPVKMVVGLAVVLVSLPLFKERYVYYFKEAYKAFEFMIRALAGLS
jgi:flagellar biosynthetic protein FliR